MADSRNSGAVRCVVVTPESTSLDTHARLVTVPLDDGQRGVGRGHSPFIGRLGAGVVRIVGEQGAGSAETVRRLYVDGGFVEVAHDVVTVITQRAIPSEVLDPASARAELERIKAGKASGDEAITAKQRAEASARALARAAAQPR